LFNRGSELLHCRFISNYLSHCTVYATAFRTLTYTSIQLKCSDEQKDQSCMNCVIYGVKCQYTPPYSPSGSARKKGESPASSSKTPSNKKLSTVGDRSSQSPGLLEQDSPGSTFADDFAFSSQASGQGMVPKFATARRLAAGEFIFSPRCHLLFRYADTRINVRRFRA